MLANEGGTMKVRLSIGITTALCTGLALVALLGGGGRGGAIERSGLPLAARGPVSTALGRDDSAYLIRDLKAHNPAQRFWTTFGSDGVTVASGSHTTSLRLTDFGYASASRPISSGTRHVEGNRVSYGHAGVSEWYTNGPLGLEQGFDIPARPAVGRGPLTLGLSVSGTARLEGGAALLAGRLRYGGLMVRDAQGRRLHSWFELRGNRLAINVDDLGARYPLHIDPFIQQAELTSSDGASHSDFGVSTAISGNTIVVGDDFHNVGSNVDQGAIYVFTKPASGWADAHETAELTASDGRTGDGLGFPVAIDGDTIVAGSASHKVGPNSEQGTVYVFVKPASGWASGHETAELTASDGGVGDRLGSAVGISGDTIAAGARGFNGSRGAVYVFTRPPAGWTSEHEAAELTASNGALNDSLGNAGAVAISGNTIVAGADQAGSHGAAYVFVEPPSGWSTGHQTAELNASDIAGGDQFGSAVAVSGNTIAVGADDHSCNGGTSFPGAVYVYTMPPSGWANSNETAELCAPDAGDADNLGGSVALAGNLLVAGATAHTVGANANEGAAYAFTMPPSGWTHAVLSGELTPTDGSAQDGFGSSVGVSGTTIVVGADNHAVGGNPGQGAAYVFGAVSPTVSISAPSNDAIYGLHQSVSASYSCAAPSPATITSCSGPVASGAMVDTSSPGQHSFTVTATDSDGATASSTVTYAVLPPQSISGLKQSASQWREANKAAHISRVKKSPIGTTFTFTLNQPASITLTFKGRRCARHTKRCRRTVVAGTLRFTGHQGTDKVRFYGRISAHRKLRPGRYTVTITATSVAGTATSKPLAFTILK
jgi:hypothetical protein